MGRPQKDGSPTKGVKRKRMKEKDPNRPKRPTTAYFYYAEYCREQLKKEGGKITSIGEFTKAVSAKWRELTPTDKKPFDFKAVNDRERYDAQMCLYSGKGKKDVNRPKRPQSNYFLFLGDFRERMRGGDLDHKQIISQAGAAWKQLNDVERKPYDAGAVIEKQKYQDNMKAYNAGTYVRPPPKPKPGAAATASAPAPAPPATASNNSAQEEEEEDDDEEYDDEDEEDDE